MPPFSQLRAAPNLLTLLRLFLIPFLIITILDARWHLAFVLLFFAGLSDAMDGLLARWLSQHTRLGQYLDPIADKCMLSSLFLVLTHVHIIPRYVTILVFSRDLGILLISTLLFVTNILRDFRPTFFGKCNTFVQIVAVGLIMTSKAFSLTALPAFNLLLLRLIAILAPLSAAQYAWIVFRRISTPIDPAEPAPAA